MATATLLKRDSRIGKFLYFIINALGFGDKPKYEVPKKGFKPTDPFGPLDINRVRLDAPQELIEAFNLTEAQVKHGGRRAAIMKLAASPLLMKQTSLNIGFYSQPVVQASNEWKLEDREADLLATHGYASVILTALWDAEVGITDYHFAYGNGVWVDKDSRALSDEQLSDLVTKLLVWQNTAHTKAGVGKEVGDMYHAITEALYPH